MRYELSHDSLARQILDRVSGEAKARRQAELLVARAHKRYLDKKILLNQEDLDEIRPHEKAINFSPGEQQLIRESKAALARAARRKRQIVIGVISILSVFLLIALWQWQRSVASTRALKAKVSYENGWVTQAFRHAQSAQNILVVDQDTRGTIREVLQDIYQSGLQYDLLHDQPIKGLDINPQEEYILSITAGTNAYVWDFQGKLRYLIEHPESPRKARFLPWGGSRELLTIAGNTAYLWNGGGGQEWRYEMSGPILDFDFSIPNKTILLQTENDFILLDERGKAWNFALPPAPLIRASISPNGNELLLVWPDSVSSLPLSFAELGKPKKRFTIPGPVRDAQYIASDQIQMQVLVGFPDSTHLVFDISGKVDTFSFYKYLNQELARFPPVERFAFSAPGSTSPITLFQTDSVSIRFWSAYRKTKDGQRAGIIDFYTRYDLAILNTTFSPSGRYLLTASADGRVDIWEIEGAVKERYRRFRAQIRLAQFARDDAYLITSAGDRTVKVWRLNELKDRNAEEVIEFYEERLAR
ncbi:WD40 repeat domain-containing protein [Flavilitoribacter nigricans]|uniref:Uncharacterized protein n=1 Tax=Flavilitoribacter nigricans (strain ATCC 23147 / DSM 23189 / NBRC 102662 / NCIMB 1420 / SS-2) TaxID=1122177 RepID=A0A2D0NBU9_FLAN2|nr:hypothetical protein [Flavilitoribacter nigricans]PHN05856.1 hypothetical protein CRP01_15410 [Flavilitoribacter nigricans DSM 23189 = NBRC 102662]